ncbi:MAG TPA: DUF371 domain-containing protein [Candidatus Nitrosotalea sp.]|nr:DUF371 domain-containing protein [Nitrososphaerota archaeon]HKU33656.1 DUF371 domain-containing protein [Candidatus Nitrosotalea sp.]
MRFEIPFYGHENIRSLHPKTIEITTESHLTTNGDCIVGVKASSGCNDLPEKLKTLLQNSKSDVNCAIVVKDMTFKIKGKGNDKLTLTNPHDIVIRKSSFVCPRTLATNCDVASDFIPRQIVKALQNPDVQGTFVIEVT